MPPHDLSPRRWRLLLAGLGLLATLAAIPGAWAHSTYGAVTSGDEPHYLLTAIALAERGSLDVGPGLDAEVWREFHAAGLSQQVATDTGRRVVPHDPLLPALLAGPVGAWGWRAGRLTLALVNGFLAISLAWVAVRRFRVRPRTAAVASAIATASAPFVVYGSQVYPELPAALAVISAVGAGLARPSWRSVVGVVVAVVALPWLSVKYVPVAAVLAGLHLWRLWQRGQLRLLTSTVAAYVVLGAAYVGVHLAWYGGVTVYAAGDFFQEHGGQLAVLGTRPDYLGRSRRLIGLLVDRSFGLAAFQPAWLLLVPAVVAVVRRRRELAAWLWIAAPLATGWLVATYVAVTMHGWWFPGRHVLHALPLAVIAVALWADRSGPDVRRLAVVAGAVGVWSTAWVIASAVRKDRTVIVDFMESTDPVYRGWSHVLPDYMHVTATTWALHGLWLVAAAGAAWLVWHRGGRSSSRWSLARRD